MTSGSQGGTTSSLVDTTRFWSGQLTADTDKYFSPWQVTVYQFTKHNLTAVVQQQIQLQSLRFSATA